MADIFRDRGDYSVNVAGLKVWPGIINHTISMSPRAHIYQPKQESHSGRVISLLIPSPPQSPLSKKRRLRRFRFL